MMVLILVCCGEFIEPHSTVFGGKCYWILFDQFLEPLRNRTTPKSFHYGKYILKASTDQLILGRQTGLAWTKKIFLKRLLTLDAKLKAPHGKVHNCDGISVLLLADRDYSLAAPSVFLQYLTFAASGL